MPPTTTEFTDDSDTGDNNTDENDIDDADEDDIDDTDTDDISMPAIRATPKPIIAIPTTRIQ